MDRFDIIIERQEQLEALIQEWGFLPFFRNSIPGFSIEEMTPPQLLFGDDMEHGPWQWKGPIIANWQSAYGRSASQRVTLAPARSSSGRRRDM